MVTTKTAMSETISFKKLRVYIKAYETALKIFQLSKKFPPEEKYLLVNQIRRSSRSVCANIVEAYRKRRYTKHFISKLSDADGEASETLVWLDFSRDQGFINNHDYGILYNNYINIGKMLGGMIKHPEKFLPRT